jgi:hypothetical protein
MSETDRAIGPLIPAFSPFGGEKEKEGRLTFALACSICGVHFAIAMKAQALFRQSFYDAV